MGYSFRLGPHDTDDGRMAIVKKTFSIVNGRLVLQAEYLQNCAANNNDPMVLTSIHYWQHTFADIQLARPAPINNQ